MTKGEIEMYFTQPVLEAKKANEIEHVLIVSPVDYDQIERLAHKKETMEQWEIKSMNASSDNRTKRGRGSVRVRAINGTKYVLTAKNYLPDNISAVEEEKEVDKAMFDIFRRICPMGSKKTRYFIKQDGLTIEVDVYYDINGNPTEYCKVDIEVKNRSIGIPKLPFDTHNIITKDRTPEQEKMVLDIFQKMWQIYNKDSIHPLDLGAEW